MSTFGLLVGAAIGGRASDRFGRKAVLIVSIVVFGLLSVATGLSADVETLMAARFLTGVGLGGALPNLLALAAENSAPSQRNLALGALYAGMPAGGALASLVSVFGADGGWRLVFFIGGLAPLLLVPLLALILPDSRELKAARAAASPQGFAAALFAEGRAVRTLLLWIAFFGALVVMYVLLSWLPTLLGDQGLSKPDASKVQISFNVFLALGSVATGLVMDRMSLPRVTAAGFLVAALGLFLLYAAPVSLGVSLVVGGVVGAAVSATQTLLYAMAPRAYPTEVRGTGVGAAVAAGRLGSAIGPLATGFLKAAGLSSPLVILLLIPVVLLAGASAFALSLRMGDGARAKFRG
jgi:AAHS family 3-hydroxyphenylpropionic acid transporter